MTLSVDDDINLVVSIVTCMLAFIGIIIRIATWQAQLRTGRFNASDLKSYRDSDIIYELVIRFGKRNSEVVSDWWLSSKLEDGLLGPESVERPGTAWPLYPPPCYLPSGITTTIPLESGRTVREEIGPETVV